MFTTRAGYNVWPRSFVPRPEASGQLRSIPLWHTARTLCTLRKWLDLLEPGYANMREDELAGSNEQAPHFSALIST